MNKKSEFIEEVDQYDKVIGIIDKEIANMSPHRYHREIAVAIIKKPTSILLQQRSSKKTVYPNTWTTACAGHIPLGMSIREVAAKELKEELGFETNLYFYNKYLRILPNESYFCYWYYGLFNDQKITLQKEEVEQTKFYTIDKIQDIIRSKTANFDLRSLKINLQVYKSRVILPTTTDI